MDDKYVCPHCGHEYTSEIIQSTKNFNKSNKFICMLGCGKEFRMNSNALNGHKTINLYPFSKTFINSNKLIYLLILCIVATLLYARFSNVSQQGYIQTAMFSNDGKEVLEAVKNIKYDGDDEILNYIITRCKREALKAPAETKERNNWALTTIECLTKQLAYSESSFRMPSAGTVLIFLFFMTASIMFYRLYKKYGLRFIGIFLIVIGAIGLLGSFSMKVTLGNVYNIGLLHNRQIMVMLFLIIMIVGVITQLAIYIVRNKK